MGGFTRVTTLNFPNAQAFGLAQELLRTAPPAFRVSLASASHSITFEDPRLARLLARLGAQPWVLLPYFGHPTDYWMLTAAEPIYLDRALTRLIRFLTPSYGWFDAEQATVRQFAASRSELQRLASSLYPAGYYRWLSPSSERSNVLDRVMLWLDLEESEPRPSQRVFYTYRELHEHFLDAVAHQLWEQAEWALAEISQRHLTTAENVVFLKLQLWALQGKWQAIWDDVDFPVWASLTVPRLVRTVLLTSCYRQVLEPYDQRQDWAGALSMFANIRPRLGKLLSGPFQFDKPEVVRVVCYQAAADQDVNRLQLLEDLDLDPLTARILHVLKQVAPPPPRMPAAVSSLERALQTLEGQDFATAEQVIPTITDPETRTLLFIELAFHTHDDLIAVRAWGSYQSLSFMQQEALPGHQRYVAEYLTYLKDRMLPAGPDVGDSAQPQVEPSFGSLDQPLRTWQLIGQLERRLRVVIAARYSSQFGPEWEHKLHSDQSTLEKWREIQDKDRRAFSDYAITESTLVDYTFLNELTEMITRQWDLFLDVFGHKRSAKGAFVEKMKSVTRVRNPLAHSRTVPDNELIRAETYCNEIFDQFASA